MTTPDRPQFEFEPLNKPLCVESSLGDFLPADAAQYGLPSLLVLEERRNGTSLTVEERYLGQGVNKDRRTAQFVYIPQIFTEMQGYLTQKIGSNWTKQTAHNPRIALFEHLTNTQTIATAGSQLRQTAQQARVKELTNASQFEFLVPGLADQLLVSPVEKGNWRLFHGAQNTVFVYIQEGNGVLVSLDDLYKRDPEFVKKMITDTHLATEKNRAILSAVANLESHRIGKNAFISPALDAIAKSSAPETDITEISNVQGWLHDLLGNRIGGTPFGPEAIMRVVNVDPHTNLNTISYLNHLASCKGVEDTVKAEAQALLEGIRRMERANPQDLYHHQTIYRRDDVYQIPNRAAQAFFSGPSEYSKAILLSEQTKGLSQAEELQAFITVLENTKGKSFDEFNAALAEQLPDIFNSCADFLDWANEHISGFELPGTTDNDYIGFLIAAASTALQRKIAPTFQDVATEIHTFLNMTMPLEIEDNNWVHRLGENAGVTLKPVVADYLAKAVITYLSGQAYIKPDLAEAIDSDMITEEQKRLVALQSSQIPEPTERLARRTALLQSEGVNVERFDELAAALEIHTSEKRQTDFDVLINIFLLSRKGKLNLSSPAVKAFIVELFPDIEGYLSDIDKLQM